MTLLLKLKEEDIPKLPRHAKLRYDNARKKWIINAPERVFELDEIAAQIIQLVNGTDSIKEIIESLSMKYKESSRETIASDTIAMLQPLADKGFIVL